MDLSRFQPPPLRLRSGSDLRDYYYLTIAVGIGLLVTILAFTAVVRTQANSREKDFRAYAALTAGSLELFLSNQIIHLQFLESELPKNPSNLANNRELIRDTLRNTVFTHVTGFRRLPSGTQVSPLFSGRSESGGEIQESLLVGSSDFTKALAQLHESRLKYLTFFLEWNGQVLFTVLWRHYGPDRLYFAAFAPAANILPPDAALARATIAVEQQKPVEGLFLMEKDGTTKVRRMSREELAEARAESHVWFQAEVPILGANTTSHIYSAGEGTRSYVMAWPATVLVSGVVITLLLGVLVFGLINRNLAIKEQVRSKTKDLEIESQKAREATLAKSRFLANVSHEVRTPLNLIMGMGELLRETQLTKEQREYVESFSRASSHLLRMIDDILHIARLDTSDVNFVLKDVNTIEFLEDIGQLFYPLCQQKKIGFYCNFDPNMPRTIRIDPERLRQIIINLLNNAVKFTDTGHISLEAKVMRSGAPVPPVTRFEFSISDTGLGIPQQHLEQIFQEFYQVDTTSTRNKGGVGLGLSIVQSLVKRMNGSVRVHSEPGKGTLISVQLPVEFDSPLSWTDDYVATAESPKKALVLYRGEATAALVKNTLSAKGVEVDSLRLSPGTMEAISGKLFEYDRILAERAPDSELSYPAELGTRLVEIVDEAHDESARQPRDRDITRPLLPSRLLIACGFLPRVRKKQVLPNVEQNLFAGKSILIAEDDEGNLLLLKAYLKSLPCRYTLVKNGAEAYEAALREKPDLIITDLQMPVMDGYTLVQKLRELEKTPNSPRYNVVVLTADAMPESVELAAKLGISKFVTKPLRKRQFLQILEETLSAQA